MAKSLSELKKELARTMALEPEIKKAKYKVKNAEGKYEAIHLETHADVVVTTDSKQFVSATEKAAFADKYTKNEIDTKVSDIEGQITVINENQSALAAEDTRISGLVTGLTKTVGDNKTELDGKISAEVTRATEAEAALGTQITDGLALKVDKTAVANTLTETLEGKVLDARQGKALKDLVDAEATRAGQAEGALAGRLAVIEGVGEGSISKALADAKSYADTKAGEVDGKVATLTGRVSDVEGSVSTLSGKVSTAETDIANLKDAISNKNNNTKIFENMEAFTTASTTLEPKVGDLVFVIDIKKAYIYKGEDALATFELPAPPAGWVVFDEISTTVDLVDYLKKSEAESTYRKVSAKIAESDLDTALSSKIDGKADLSHVNTELGKKADAELVNTELAKKVNTADLDGAIDAKVNPVKEVADAASAAVAKEVTDRKGEITRVEGLVSGVDSKADAIDGKVTALADKVTKSTPVIGSIEPLDTAEGHIWLEVIE